MQKILFILILIVSSFANTNSNNRNDCNCGCYTNYQAPTCNKRVVCNPPYRACCRLDYFAPIEPYIDYY